MPSTRKQDERHDQSYEAREKLTSEFRDYLGRTDLTTAYIRLLDGAAKHFLIWAVREQIHLRSIDDNAVRQFRFHNCVCPMAEGGLPRHKRCAPQLRKTMYGVEHFVQFLEQTGRTDDPGEQALGQHLLTAFLADCKSQGFSASVRRKLRSHSSHFLVWLHRTRTSITSVSPDVMNDFLNHDCICPRYFIKPRRAEDRTIYALLIRKFVNFLGDHGVAPNAYLDAAGTNDSSLGDFRRWLAQHRGVTASTIHTYCREVSPIVEKMGEEPTQYDVALLRETLLDRLGMLSVTHARNVLIAVRMYVRFLATRNECDPSLIDAIPKPSARGLWKPPRHIPMKDIERVIAACDGCTAAGIRDKAILLLLARLALRAGDISALQLSDIDWCNGRLHVCGKSKRSTWLPLPQDAGDALLEYITTSRPNIATGRVFLRVRAPNGPLGSSHTVSDIVSSAMKRAGVVSPGTAGAYLFRHSVATDLLRSGASLEFIGALLRHQSPDTTMIYAKADVPMLHEVAQPWIGGAK
ncbi:MAG: tyrosine-type recombinase/integrase [Gammaproteobacteria bacterium]|nr:tyrosine-type recombinase/integrase [Gammaproteobacteria bacterium]MYF58648.1 tyrosine-type recombinase/integrase [Gammaproteobacteria bacterium]